MFASPVQKKPNFSRFCSSCEITFGVFFLVLVDDSVQKVRIITHTFPRYFALISRFRHETVTIGPEGGTLSSKAIPDVRAIFPPESIKKSSKVQLQVC